MVFLRYFETARIAYLRALAPSLNAEGVAGAGAGTIFAECHINYRSPVHFDDELVVTCTINSVRRSSFRVAFEMRVQGRLVAEGYGVLVAYDYGAGHAAALPDEVREALEAEERTDRDA